MWSFHTRNQFTVGGGQNVVSLLHSILPEKLTYFIKGLMCLEMLEIRKHLIYCSHNICKDFVILCSSLFSPQQQQQHQQQKPTNQQPQEKEEKTDIKVS